MTSSDPHARGPAARTAPDATVKPVDGGAIAAAGGTAAGLTGLALAVVLVLGLV